MADTRRSLGGSVWARADSVSRDAKRIYGSQVGNTWLEGTVIEVVSQKKNPSAKRATTYVKARYVVGNTEKITTLPLQVLKDKEPREEVPTPGDNNENRDVNIPAAENGTNVGPQQPAPHPPPVVAAAGGRINLALPHTAVTPAAIPTVGSGNHQNPVSSNNGCNWYEGITDVDMNGPVSCAAWKMTCQFTGAEFTAGCDNTQGGNASKKDCKYTPYDFFLACFPKEHLKAIAEQTSANLTIANKPPTSIGEVLKWIGVTILITRYEFGQRCTLWSSESGSKYMPAANIGYRTGMSRDRYDTLMQHMSWSFQPYVRPENLSSEEYRWMLVSDFVDRINEHWKKYFTPGGVICVDESISRWYGLGGHWINMGLPMYVAFDRKPDDGCEIQNACCGKCGIMMQLRLVKSHAAMQAAAAEAEATGAVDDDNGCVCLMNCLLLLQVRIAISN